MRTMSSKAGAAAVVLALLVCAPVLLICRSGDRSARAANLLSQLGYAAVYTVVDGFEGDAIASGDKQGQRLINGWKNAGLPWSYNLGKARAYFPKY